MKYLDKNMQLAFCKKKARRDSLIASYESSNGKIIQEWTKTSLQKTAFKKIEVAWSVLTDHIFKLFENYILQISLGIFFNSLLQIMYCILLPTLSFLSCLA